ncbi:MAG: thioredoxin-disulfide reductase [Clostridia bacterium]|nr:thioredoxin-disulfide reductase [Clostridia bacterium]
MAAVNINQEQFNRLIAGEKPVLVDFWAPWCTYCRRISDAYDRIAQEYADRLEVVKVNIDDNEALAIQEKIEIIPTLVIYRGGKAAASIVAPESKAMIEGFIGDLLPQEEEKESRQVHDMVIVGGGPGGYTAALYAARSGLDTLVIEKLSAGGQMAQTHQIDNYPGFEEGIDGYELAGRMQRQAHRFGAKTVYAEVDRIDLAPDVKRLETSEGIFYGKTVVLAMGASPRPLGVEKEQELTGRGVAYCAACDGMMYKGKTVVVVGGGNSAAADAMILSRIAKKVILVHRRDTLRATKVYHDPLKKAENIEFRWNSVVKEIEHDDRVTGVRLKNVVSGEEETVACDGVFVSVGRKPASQLAQGQLELDESGYIAADETTQTSLPGVYAVGDVRTKALRQVVTAVADGAMAVHMAEEYLAGK